MAQHEMRPESKLETAIAVGKSQIHAKDPLALPFLNHNFDDIARFI